MIGLSLIVFGFITDISTQIRQLEIQLYPDKFDSMDKFFYRIQKWYFYWNNYFGYCFTHQRLSTFSSKKRQMTENADIT